MAKTRGLTGSYSSRGPDQHIPLPLSLQSIHTHYWKTTLATQLVVLHLHLWKNHFVKNIKINNWNKKNNNCSLQKYRCPGIFLHHLSTICWIKNFVLQKYTNKLPSHGMELNIKVGLSSCNNQSNFIIPSVLLFSLSKPCLYIEN